MNQFVTVLANHFQSMTAWSLEPIDKTRNLILSHGDDLVQLSYSNSKLLSSQHSSTSWSVSHLFMERSGTGQALLDDFLANSYLAFLYLKLTSVLNRELCIQSGQVFSQLLALTRTCLEGVFDLTNCCEGVFLDQEKETSVIKHFNGLLTLLSSPLCSFLR